MWPTSPEADDFLARRPRYAMLTTLRRDGSPTTVVVWYDWDGDRVSMFSFGMASKVARIQRDPRVTVTVGNDVDEAEQWVAFDGTARVEQTGGLELAERLASSYWDLNDPDRVATLKAWQDFGADAFRLILVEPTKVREYP